MSTTDTDGNPVGHTGHVWPCTRFYITSSDQDPCTCTPLPIPDTERDERLRGIQKRAAAATEGPWNYGGQGWVFAEASRGDRRGEMADLLADLHTHDEDALFIVAARADVPWLLAEVTRLEEALRARKP